MLVSKAFNVRRISYSNPSNDLASPSRHVGLEIEVENAPGIVAPSQWHGWETHADNSLRNNGMEFVTPPLYGEELVRYIQTFCEEATKAGFVGNVRTGTHIHVNMSLSDVACLEHVVGVYSVFEPALFRMVGEWRKWSNFCAPLSEATGICHPLRKLFNGKTEAVLRHTARELEGLRYSALNLASLAKYGTIEFRIFPTSFSPQELIAWVNIVLLIVEYGEHLHSTKVKTIDALNTYGIVQLAHAVFSKRPECLQSVLSFIKPKDQSTALNFLANCSAVTSELLEGASLGDEADKHGAAAQFPGSFREAVEEGANPLSILLAGMTNQTNSGLGECEILKKYKQKNKKKPHAAKKSTRAKAVDAASISIDDAGAFVDAAARVRMQEIDQWTANDWTSATQPTNPFDITRSNPAFNTSPTRRR